MAVLAAALIFGRSQTDGQTYNIYFGDNHSHTWYSDGNADQNPSTYTLPVARSITWARTNRSSFDFLGISDHNHVDGGYPMTLALWRSAFRQADSVNQDGNFVGYYGQEWGTLATGAGHLLIYGTDKLFGWNPGVYDVYVVKNNFAMLIDSVKKYNGYAYLAHPGSSDFSGLFQDPYDAKTDSVVRGLAVKSGLAFSTNTSETDPASSNYEARYHDLLRLGYHVAPIGNQDNHNTTFGKSNQQRTGLLAASLSKANVDDAFRNRRVYATEDHNLQIRIEVGTHAMGEIFTTATPVPIRVKAYDPDGESISSITVRYGVPGSGSAPTTLQTVSNRDSLVISQAQPLGSTYYYYAYVVEADGHRGWSAPVWVTTAAGSAPGSFALLTPSSGAANQPVSGTLSWQPSSGATSYDLYLGTANPPTAKVGSDLAGTAFNYSGLANNTLYYWKVVAKNPGGSTDATASPWNFRTVIASPSNFSLISPSSGTSGVPVSGALTWQASVNATSYDVYLGSSNPPSVKVSSGQTGTSYPFSGLTNGATYYWKVVARNSVDSVQATGSPWNFSTIISAPGQFSLLSPPDSALNLPVAGALSWRSSPGAASYDVYLGLSDPPVTIVSTDQTDTTYGYAGLVNDAAYYWKVVAKNAGGSTAVPSRRFTTIVSGPGPFSQIAPLNNSLNQGVFGRLEWDSSSRAALYAVYLDTLNPPLHIASAAQTDTFYNYSGLMNSKNYYWKVVASNLGGSSEGEASPWKFSTIVEAPGEFQLMAPADLSTAQPVGGILSWQTSPNAESYEVYLDTINPPAAKLDSNLSLTERPYVNLSPGTTYYWNVKSVNAAGGRFARLTAFSFTTVNVPRGVADLHISSVSQNNLEITWVDNASNEAGYRVYRAVDSAGIFETVGPDLPANADGYLDLAVSPNHRYYYRIVPFNQFGEGSFATVGAVTLAEIPGPPLVSELSYGSMRVTLDPASNPAYTQFSIKLRVGQSENFLHADGSLSPEIEWNDLAGWSGSSGILVGSLAACESFSLSARARNAAMTESPWGDSASGEITCYSVEKVISSGWNLISSPVLSADPRKSAIFPSGVSMAFSFQGSYVQTDTILNGHGYWIKFDEPFIKRFEGSPAPAETIIVQTGWNMIGGGSSDLSVGAVRSEPGGIIASNFYGFDGSYSNADLLSPGNGYWVKVTGSGKIFFDGPQNLPKDGSLQADRPERDGAELRFTRPDGSAQTLRLFADSLADDILFALPPVPPDGAFDVRFSSQSSAGHIGDLRENIFPVEIRSADFPIRLTATVTKRELELRMLDGDREVTLSSGNGYEIRSSSLSLIARIGRAATPASEYGLFQNFPNPFNPETVIRFDLPGASLVTLKVYDAIGSEVSTILDRRPMSQGAQDVKFDGRDLNSGVYFCILTAENSDGARSAKTMKIILIK